MSIEPHAAAHCTTDIRDRAGRDVRERLAELARRIPEGHRRHRLYVIVAGPLVEEVASLRRTDEQRHVRLLVVLEPSAAYLAVCRPADDERLRVQIRPFAGAQTTATEHDIVPSGTVAPETVAFVRLVIESAGTCATGFGSRDGATWVEIDSACFDTPLRWQGLAASSHDGGVVRFLFGNVRRDGGAPRTAGDFARATAFGTGSATVFDGVLP